MGRDVSFLHRRAGLPSAPEAAFPAVRKENRSEKNHLLLESRKTIT